MNIIGQNSVKNVLTTRSLSTFIYITCLVYLYGMPSTWAWIDHAGSGDEDPPILCMLEYGDVSVYKRSIYQIQARYHSWVGDWSLQRPKGFPKDEGMELLIREDVVSLIVKILEIGIQPPLIHYATWSHSIKDNSGEEQNATTDCNFPTLQAVANGIQVVVKLRLPIYQVIESTRGIKTHIKVAVEKFLKHNPQSKNKTGKAATRIRAFHRAEANEQSVLAGVTLLESELKKHNYSLNRLRKESKMEKMINHHKMGSERELMMDLGYGKLDVAKALEPLFPNNSEAVKVQQKVNFNDLQQQTPPSKISSNAILVDGEEGMAVHYPQCCSPIPGDEVTGFVTLGRGVTIHRNSCPHCLDYDPSRRVNVGWKQGIKSHRSVGIRIFSSDAKGLLASISSVLHKSGVNITAVNCQTTEEHRAINDFTINIKDLEQLQELRTKLKQIEGITEVERITH